MPDYVLMKLAGVYCPSNSCGALGGTLFKS